MTISTKLATHRRLSWWFSLCIVALSSATTEAAEPTSDSPHTDPSDLPTTGSIRVHVEPGIADADLFPGWIAGRNPEIAEKLPPAPGHEQWISIDITGVTYDYRATIMIIRDGQTLDSTVALITCECNSETLLDQIDQGIDDAVGQLTEAQAEPPPIETPPPLVVEPRVVEPDRGDHQRRLRVKGYVGIGLGLLGAALLTTGIPLTLQQDMRPGPHGFEERPVRIYGAVYSTVGGVALITGASLLVVDLARTNHPRTTVRPSVGPRFAGVYLRKTF